MPEEVAIEAAIKGLHIGPFAAHLAREKPASMQELYHEFEKYYKSDNDFRKRLKEQNQQKKQASDRNLQRNNVSRDGRQLRQEQGNQMFNIEQPKNDQPGKMPPPTETPNIARRFHQTEGSSQSRGWGKIRSRDNENNTVSFMEKRKDTQLEIVRMPKKPKKESKAGPHRSPRNPANQER